MVIWLYVCWFVVFKHKTAYEMRISDWSSDVCSFDLVAPVVCVVPVLGPRMQNDEVVHELHVALLQIHRELHFRPRHHRIEIVEHLPLVVGQPDALLLDPVYRVAVVARSEEHTSELQSLMRISYAVF